MHLIDDALGRALPTAEKLVLVYLASRANAAGVGLWDRNELGELTGYKPRSIQRLLKSLRDLEVIEDLGAWYRIRREWPAPEPLPELPAAEELEHYYPPPMTPGEFQASIEAAPPIDARQVGDTIAARVVDASEYLIDQLANFEQRLGQQLARLVDARPAPLTQPQEELMALDPESMKRALALYLWKECDEGLQECPGSNDGQGRPYNWRRWFWKTYQVPLEEYLEETGLINPPDPVLENPLYQQLLDQGINQARAYALSQADLELDESHSQEPERELPPPAPPPPADRVLYPDHPAARCRMVKDILTGGPSEIDGSELRAWQALEEAENKHSVAGEPPAFALLFPAIIDAAMHHAGTMTLLEFIDADKAAKGTAPWDQDPWPSAMEDPKLEREIGRMLADLADVPETYQVGPRTVEKGEDGRTRTETIVGYHRRVLGKWNQAQKARKMGII